MLDTGYHTCFINPDTGEFEMVYRNEMEEASRISWSDVEDDDEDDDDETKEQWARIDSWKRCVRLEKPESHESFKIMEDFVDEVIPEGKLKEQFWRALTRSHPFRNFNDIVHNCEYREDWFKFKQAALEEYVKKEVEYL
jgi:hypothetical protein